MFKLRTMIIDPDTVNSYVCPVYIVQISISKASSTFWITLSTCSFKQSSVGSLRRVDMGGNVSRKLRGRVKVIFVADRAQVNAPKVALTVQMLAVHKVRHRLTAVAAFDHAGGAGTDSLAVGKVADQASEVLVLASCVDRRMLCSV